MNDNRTNVRHPSPPRPAQRLANAFVTTILRSRWHGLRSNRLLLLTFTGRTSGKAFTTPLRYAQKDDTLLMTVVYPWWKNLRERPTVRVLLRGQWRTGVAEVFPEHDNSAIVKVYLSD